MTEKTCGEEKFSAFSISFRRFSLSFAERRKNFGVRPRDNLGKFKRSAGDSSRKSTSTCNGRPGGPPRGIEVSTKTLPCALRCPACPPTDVTDVCRRPRVQELSSEASWQLFFRRRASTPWSSIRRRSSAFSAMRERGELRLCGMVSCGLCEGPCSSVGEAGACASGRSRTFYCEFLRVSVLFVILAMLVVSACRVRCISIA